MIAIRVLHFPSLFLIFPFRPTSHMETYLYISLIPEALVLSHLPPEKFGAYLATGSKRQIEGPALFLSVDQSADLSAFRIEEGRARCVTHPDGSPRCSTYLSVFNVLSRVPISAIQKAYLTTQAGLTLELSAAEWKESDADRYFLYQELGPVYPRVASRLEPEAFCKLVTDPDKMVWLPAMAFIDLKLDGLAMDPEARLSGHLPYQHLDHLRNCLRGIRDNPERMTKIVHRGLRPDILFYLIRNGLFLGSGGGFLYFPLPSEEILETRHTLWWHSAQTSRGY